MSQKILVSKLPEFKLFCHSHNDYLFRLTTQFRKEKLAVFPMQFRVEQKYHTMKALTVVRRGKSQEVFSCFRKDPHVIRISNPAWPLIAHEVGHYASSPREAFSEILKEYEFLVFSYTASHENEPSVSKFSRINNLLLRYFCITEGNDFFSLLVKPQPKYTCQLREKMSRFGEFCDENDMLLCLRKLGKQVDCSDQFGVTLFCLLKHIGFEDEDVRVYFKARQYRLFDAFSLDLLEKCAYSISMQPYMFRRKFYKISNAIAPMVGRLSMAFIGQ